MKDNIKKTLNLEAFKISKLTNHRFIMGGGQSDEDDDFTLKPDSTRGCLEL